MAAGAAERPHLQPQTGGEAHWGWPQSLSPWHTSQPFPTVPPTGGKVFKHINLWGHSHLNHHKVSWLSFQWDYEELPSNTGKQYAWKHFRFRGRRPHGAGAEALGHLITSLRDTEKLSVLCSRRVGWSKAMGAGRLKLPAQLPSPKCTCARPSRCHGDKTRSPLRVSGRCSRRDTVERQH